MSATVPDAGSVSRAIETLVRTDRGRLLSALIARLKNFQLAEDALPFHAAHAELLSRSGRTDTARAAYDRAIELASNPSDATFLRCRRDLVAHEAVEGTAN